MKIKNKWNIVEEILLYELFFEKKIKDIEIAKIFNVCILDIICKKELMINNIIYYNDEYYNKL